MDFFYLHMQSMMRTGIFMVVILSITLDIFHNLIWIQQLII